MQTIISLVSADMGLALVPASLRNLARTGVRYLPLAGPAPLLETGLAWRRSDEAPTLRALLGIALDMERADRLTGRRRGYKGARRSDEHTSELQSLMRISYDVFCLKKK